MKTVSSVVALCLLTSASALAQGKGRADPADATDISRPATRITVLSSDDKPVQGVVFHQDVLLQKYSWGSHGDFGLNLGWSWHTKPLFQDVAVTDANGVLTLPAREFHSTSKNVRFEQYTLDNSGFIIPGCKTNAYGELVRERKPTKEDPLPNWLKASCYELLSSTDEVNRLPSEMTCKFYLTYDQIQERLKTTASWPDCNEYAPQN